MISSPQLFVNVLVQISILLHLFLYCNYEYLSFHHKISIQWAVNAQNKIFLLQKKLRRLIIAKANLNDFLIYPDDLTFNELTGS